MQVFCFWLICKFDPLCRGKRGCDTKYGCENYGASCDGGKRKHEGLDIVCADGATVYAPFDVKLRDKAAPYKKNNAINDGINREGLCFKLLYVKHKLLWDPEERAEDRNSTPNAESLSWHHFPCSCSNV
ncbi:hypothetical protein Q8A67_013720 [Cirrhinus molitorella]|uniref:Uncharacterized protein n=1 Tax=Cirrhinus molitorella TaxID=172907 RepID=A0AA88PQ34_9TELE|nr:hypothetical protein Q8A67_013720 [Cirrhinus molitorella]